MKKSVIPYLSRLIPEPLIRQIAGEMYAHLRHWPSWAANRTKFRGRSNLKVNVGCGHNSIFGWINLDLTRDPNVICWDCRRRLPFDDNSVSTIFAEHVFEHLSHPHETSPFLAECLRCLEPGGSLRIVVPDAGKYLRLYGGSWHRLAHVRSLQHENGVYRDPWLNCSYRTQMELMNAIFRQGTQHKYAYDAETLILFLRDAGFRQTAEQQYGASSN